MSDIQVSADDVFAVIMQKHTELLSEFARSEARRVYLEKRVESLEEVIRDNNIQK